MNFEILLNEAKLPAQNNLTWIFPVLASGERREWHVDDFDLNLWFKEAIGRYPAHKRGDRDTFEDLKANWSRVQERFYQELTKQLELGTVISIEGVRISARDWDAVRDIPVEDLPPLRDSQREAARKMRVSEEEYARSFLAGERSRATLIAKTDRLARFVAEHLKEISPDARLDGMSLDTTERRFQVELLEGKTRIPVAIREELVDDFFEGGSLEAKGNIVRILETATKYHGRAIQ